MTDETAKGERQWASYLLLGDYEYVALVEAKAALETEAAKGSDWKKLAEDMKWAMKALLMSCSYEEGGESHRQAEELIAKFDAEE